MQRTLETDLLEGLQEDPKEHEEFVPPENITPLLPKIEEDDEDERKDEAQRFVRFAKDGKTVELISPQQRGVLKIRNP